MFSASDIEEITRLLPPSKDPDGHFSSLPSLLPLSDGQGFITTQHAFHEFERIVTTAGSKRISAAAIGHKLGIAPEAVLQFANSAPNLTLLSKDNSSIIPGNQRQSVHERLRELVTQGIVSKTAFAQEQDVSLESIDNLIRTEENGERLQDSLINIDDYMTTKTYESVLSKSIKHHVDESMKNESPVELTPNLLLGTPPIWYISQVLNSLLQDTSLASQVHIDTMVDSVRCVPKESILRKRQAEITQLQEGSTPFVDLSEFFDRFREVYASVKDVEEHFATYPDIDVRGTTALSSMWLTIFGDECVGALEILGYADLTSKIKADFPPEYHIELFDKLESHILAKYQDKTGNAKPQRAGDYLLTSSRYKTDCDLLLQSAQAHAAHQWEQLKETSDKELKFQLSDIIAFIPDDQSILRAVSESDSVKKSVEEHYWSEISDLETKNEAEFSTLWTERVLPRFNNYTEGLTAIEDAKLRDQLSELLSGYLSKELVPDALSKARSQGLVCSRKTKKNTQKLESTLNATKGDVSSVIGTIEKFGKKQGIQDLDTTALAQTKDALVQDMVRKMRKQSDGPTLFLTLVMVLLAKQCSGIVYATGKFAPKLMRLLKFPPQSEQYTQIEKWKDLAKAGSLSALDKVDMEGLVANGPR